MHCLLDLSSRSEPLIPSKESKEENLPSYSQSSDDDAGTSYPILIVLFQPKMCVLFMGYYSYFAENEGYMILLQTQTEGETIETLWKGETVRISVCIQSLSFSYLTRNLTLVCIFRHYGTMQFFALMYNGRFCC